MVLVFWGIYFWFFAFGTEYLEWLFNCNSSQKHRELLGWSADYIDFTLAWFTVNSLQEHPDKRFRIVRSYFVVTYKFDHKFVCSLRCGRAAR